MTFITAILLPMLRTFRVIYLLLLVTAVESVAAPADTTAAERAIRQTLRRGDVALKRADYPTATILAQRALRDSRRLGTTTETELMALKLLLGVAFNRSDAIEATDYARQALKRRQRLERGAGPSEETRQLMGDARSRRHV